MDLAPLTARMSAGRRLPVDGLLLYRTLSSTNEAAGRLARRWPGDLALPTILVVALEQTAGRGRDGRGWESPSGDGVYASLVVSLGDRQTLSRVPLAVAVGLCDAVSAFGVEDCRVKWPNDLVIGNRKLGGILIEALGGVDGPVKVVVGFGVNLTTDREKLEALTATSIELETGAAPALEAALVECGRAVCLELAALCEGAVDDLVARYRTKIVHRPGDRILWRGRGGESVEGRYERIDDEGRLEMKTESGMKSVNAGEIVVA